jgi:TolB protein
MPNCIHKTIALATLLLLGNAFCLAQNKAVDLSELGNYTTLRSRLLQNEGKWLATNNAKTESVRLRYPYLAFEFSVGINAYTLQFKATIYDAQNSIWKPTNAGYLTWNQHSKKLMYQTAAYYESISVGTAQQIGYNQMSFELSQYSNSGDMLKVKETWAFNEDGFVQSEAIFSNSKWEPNVSYTYRPMPQPSGRISFMTTRDGNFEIYSMDAKGENLKNITCNKATDYGFSHTPNGRLVFYSNREGNDEIYVQEADGKKTTNLTNHPAADRITCVSPDGKKIAFISSRDHEAGEIYVMDIDGSHVKRLTNNDNFEDAPSWSPDGKQLVFSRDIKPASDSSKETASNGEVFVMDADGSHVRRLTNRPGFDGGPQFSPDGKQIAFYGKTETGNYEIFIMGADGGNLVNLTEDPMEDYSPSWSLDGQWIAYTKGDSKNYDVWLIHLATRIKTRLTTQPKRDESPFWEPVK